MTQSIAIPLRIGARMLLAAALPVLLSLSACTNAGGLGGNTGGNTGGDPGGSTDDGGNTLLTDALGNEGTLSGKVVDSQSTRASTADSSAAQEVPPEFDTTEATVSFFDVAGAPLLDENGNPLAEVPLEPDGSFEAENLPVGTDFTVCADLENDGTCDVQSCVNIPSDNGGAEGHLDGAQVDPLTTMVLAKLHDLAAARGLTPDQLPISPVALVRRIVDAYINLFDASGVDHEVTLDDIAALSAEDLAALFDSIIPDEVRNGMRVIEGNLDLSRAADVNAAGLAAATVFLRAGFPIADQPQGLDLSSLADLEGVEVTDLRSLMQQGDPFKEDFEDVDEDLPVPPAQLEGGFSPTVYINTSSEPDRNFSEDALEDEGPGGPHLPIIHDYLLLEMARLQLQGRRINLRALHELVTSLDNGLGARLTYFIFDPNFVGPPLNIFETADGRGKAINVNDLFSRLFDGGFGEADREALEQRDAELRRLLAELLEGTLPPNIERLAGAFLIDRFAGIDDLAARIREARAHLPFSRTGPSSFFVVADGDPVQSDSAAAVTVDAEFDREGLVTRITYNTEGSGRFYLSFTHGTQETGGVGLMVRETGRPYHHGRGPVRLNMRDGVIFQPVNGEPFVEFVSNTGNFLPGINIPVVRTDFVPMPVDGALPPLPVDGSVTPPPPPPDGTTSEIVTAQVTPPPPPPPGSELTGPTQQIFVLATQPGPGAEPVRIDYDPATGTGTFNPAGRNLLQFIPGTQETGVFGLFNEKTGRPARDEDPTDFFTPPIERPDGFEDVFNDPSMVGDLLDGVGLLPPDGIVDPNAPPPPDDPVTPAGTDTFAGQIDEFGNIVISIDNVTGLPVQRQTFTNVFGTEVANPRYNPDGDPYYDDVNDNGVQDEGETTTHFRPLLFDLRDWRSTDIRLYYRRADNGAAVTFEEVDFMSSTPKTLDGVDLVERNYRPRLNAFRFGRPNTAMNLLTTFLPPEFFDGAHGITEETSFDIFGAVAIINLMMDQVHNVEVDVDIDGLGPLPSTHTVIDAHIFVPPIGDPFVLMLKGFESRSAVPDAAN